MNVLKKNLMATVGITALLITSCTILMNTILSDVAIGDENIIKAAKTTNKSDFSSVMTSLTEQLHILVYTQGKTIPTDAISANYAAAIAVDVGERVFNAPLKGRTFVRLQSGYGLDSGYYWYVVGEVDGGVINLIIDAKSGVERFCFYQPGAFSWSWFDNWNEHDAESERIAAEARIAMINDDSNISKGDQQQLSGLKRQAMLDFAQLMADSPYGSRAVEAVNRTGISDGALALSGMVMAGDSDPGYCTRYFVEVQLDNGRYIQVILSADNYQLLGYERYDLPLLDFLY